MLRDFPPLNYLFYPAVPEKYIVPVDNPWEVTAEALAVMQELAEKAGDEKLGKMLRPVSYTHLSCLLEFLNEVAGVVETYFQCDLCDRGVCLLYTSSAG